MLLIIVHRNREAVDSNTCCVLLYEDSQRESDFLDRKILKYCLISLHSILLIRYKIFCAV